MTSRQRKVRRTPLRISYADFRNESAENACCGGDGGPTTALAVLIARDTAETRPAEALDELLIDKEGVGVHGAWHHALVGELLLVCLRNAGYPISDEVIDEVIDRGQQLAGGSCGFLGVCGALVSAASAYSVLLGSTPVATEAREKLIAFAARLHQRLAEVGGSRCCKKSSYVALEVSRDELAKIGFELPEEQLEGRCRFFSLNETCDGETCVYFPRQA